ncbi:MAG TPA: phosphodiesterase [Geminicoccus sp.]|uniref:phosphodiesterase n=1 Tax=Geminicoccus sp. TaxID=2024832 RepID=UPI002BDE15C1|nr:phosphodiesterase [Geminicoccus sp.]HWL69887.1 phosphodiesterase [Geminicoccus sp.]
MIIAQLTDLHARPRGELSYGGLDTAARLRRAVDMLLASDPAPDCVLVTGDLTDRGLPEEYEQVAENLGRLPMPVFVLPGNHDRREMLRECLAGRYGYLRDCGDFLHYVVEEFPVRLIGLDTVADGEDGGELCHAREAWLAERLREGAGRPTLIFMHHPPFLTGITGMDSIMCRTSPGLAELIRCHPEVERVVSGHYHRPITVRWAGTVGFVTPGLGLPVALNLQPGAPTRFNEEPPAYAIHAWQPETGMVSHLVPVGAFGTAREYPPSAESSGARP